MDIETIIAKIINEYAKPRIFMLTSRTLDGTSTYVAIIQTILQKLFECIVMDVCRIYFDSDDHEETEIICYRRNHKNLFEVDEWKKLLIQHLEQFDPIRGLRLYEVDVVVGTKRYLKSVEIIELANTLI